MPGEQENAVTTAPTLSSPEVVVGAVISQEELEMLLLRNQAKAKPFCAYTRHGDKYTVAFLERCGFAMYSHQTSQVWMFELPDMLRLAKAAGLDREAPTIIVPGGHHG